MYKYRACAPPFLGSSSQHNVTRKRKLQAAFSISMRTCFFVAAALSGKCSPLYSHLVPSPDNMMIGCTHSGIALSVPVPGGNGSKLSSMVPITETHTWVPNIPGTPAPHYPPRRHQNDPPFPSSMGHYEAEPKKSSCFRSTVKGDLCGTWVNYADLPPAPANNNVLSSMPGRFSAHPLPHPSPSSGHGYGTAQTYHMSMDQRGCVTAQCTRYDYKYGSGSTAAQFTSAGPRWSSSEQHHGFSSLPSAQLQRPFATDPPPPRIEHFEEDD